MKQPHVNLFQASDGAMVAAASLTPAEAVRWADDLGMRDLMSLTPAARSAVTAYFGWEEVLTDGKTVIIGRLTPRRAQPAGVQ